MTPMAFRGTVYANFFAEPFGELHLGKSGSRNPEAVVGLAPPASERFRALSFRAAYVTVRLLTFQPVSIGRG
jgi:hypothetical protein